MNLNHVQAIILDMDGTLIKGRQPVPGLVAFADFLNHAGIAFVVVTNNTVKTPHEYSQNLLDFGFPVNSEQILTAALATAVYLQHRYPPGMELYVIGERGLREALQLAGFDLTLGMAAPARAVVVGGDRQLTYKKLREAIHHLQTGAAFLGTNPDLLIPTERGPAPEAGVTLAALQAATGLIPTIIGKPERPLFDIAMQRMKSSPRTTAILGDRLDTDILGGQRLGLTTILIRNSDDDLPEMSRQGVWADYVVKGLDQLIDMWEREA